MTVEKKCPNCGDVFMGVTWETSLEDAERPVPGYCLACVERMEKAVARADHEMREAARKEVKGKAPDLKMPATERTQVSPQLDGAPKQLEQGELDGHWK